MSWGPLFPPTRAAMGPPLCRAQLCSSPPPQVPLRALPAVPRHAVVPHQHGLLGGARALQPRPDFPRYPTGVRDLRAGVSVRPRREADGRTDVVAVVLHSVCVLKAAVRPLAPCPACPAARARCLVRPGWREGRELSTYPPGTRGWRAPRHAWGAAAARGPAPPRACFSLMVFFVFLSNVKFFWCVLPFFASTPPTRSHNPSPSPSSLPVPKSQQRSSGSQLGCGVPVSSAPWLGGQAQQARGGQGTPLAMAMAPPGSCKAAGCSTASLEGDSGVAGSRYWCEAAASVGELSRDWCKDSL